MSAQHQLPKQHQLPNQSDLSDDQLNRVAFAIAGILSKHGMWHERPLRAKEAMEFIGVKKNTFYSLINNGYIREHRPDPAGHAFYFPSELTEDIKKKSLNS